MISNSQLIARIQSNRPDVKEILPYSYPVTSFGDVTKARILTVGINPSVDEFCSRKRGRALLEASSKRLVDSESLGIEPGQDLSLEQAQRILLGNNNYFQTGNAYGWFNYLEQYALKPIGASYFDGSAAHVDLVQWATNPVWSNIQSEETRLELMSESLPFLSDLFSSGQWDLVMINGSQVERAFRQFKIGQFFDLEEHRIGSATRVFRNGRIGRSPLISWSANLPVYGTSVATREYVADWVPRAVVRLQSPEFRDWFAAVTRD